MVFPFVLALLLIRCTILYKNVTSTCCFYGSGATKDHFHSLAMTAESTLGSAYCDYLTAMLHTSELNNVSFAEKYSVPCGSIEIYRLQPARNA